MYEFKEQDAIDFAHHVGIKAQRRGEELHFLKCPYCKETTKDQKTFAINMRTGQFKCLRSSCGVHGNMITLSKDFDFDIGIATEYYNPRKKYKSLKNVKPESKPKAIEYMLSRGIPEEITKKYKITTRKDNDDIVVFPFYDENNILQFVKYRNINFKKGGKGSKEFTESNCKPILFGMSECDLERSDTLIVTEGQIDSLSVAAAGVPNAVSVPTGAKGFTFMPYCWDFLTKFKTIIVFGDHENGAITLLDEFSARFDNVKHIRPEDYKDKKDANDILRTYGADAIRNAINHAVFTENPRIKPLVNIKKKVMRMLKTLNQGLKA